MNTMKVIRVIAALANRQRDALINCGVGFSTFAVGDALSQGARPPPPRPPLMMGQSVATLSCRQQLVERTQGVDYARSLKVGLLGILLNGFALGAWYRVLDLYLGADRTRVKTLVSKCVVDQMVYAPFSITSFVSYAAVLKGGGAAAVLSETKQNLRETFWSTWLMDWRVWPAANLVMFRFIPSSYRPSFASVVQVAWQTYMSSVSYDNPHHHSTVLPTDAKDSDGLLLVRGGGGAATATGGKQGEGGAHGVPSPGTLVSSVVGVRVDGGKRPAFAAEGRRVTARYAYMATADSDRTEEAGAAAAVVSVVRGSRGTGKAPSNGSLEGAEAVTESSRLSNGSNKL